MEVLPALFKQDSVVFLFIGQIVTIHDPGILRMRFRHILIVQSSLRTDIGSMV